MIAMQMLAWAFFSFKGGSVTDKQFYLFTIGMLIGQAGTSVETFLAQTWGTFIVQIYFFSFTLIGGIKRYRFAKLKTVK
jgi:hypothetical protein